FRAPVLLRRVRVTVLQRRAGLVLAEEQERRQVERLESVREERDDEAVEAALAALGEAAAREENLMPYIVDAVKACATTGEICDALRDVFGEYQPGAAL
ncbi:hypothetical protein BRC67_03475, partial [Halobacteriales archaeon QH_3_68_24]